MRRLVRIGAAAVSLALLGGGAWLLRSHDKQDPASTLRTAPVKHYDLVGFISATGTVEPEEAIGVGAQVAGKISTFGKDRNGKSIDYGSEIEENPVLALIDDTLYAAT
jgi:HlyD family secretion protein